MKSYLISTQAMLSSLEAMVNTHIEQGNYVPIGGPFLNESSGIWCQALYRKPAPKKAKAAVQYDDYFNKLWGLYPKRNGSNPKNKAYSAYKARLKEVSERAEIHLGMIRYINWCEATHKTGTETVMQAARFFGPGLEFMNDWALPEETAVFLPEDNAELEAYAKKIGMKNPAAYPNESWNEYRKRIERAKKHIEQGLGSKPGQ